MKWMSILENLDVIARDAPDVSQPLTFTTATSSVNVSNYRKCLCVLIVTDAGTGTAVTLNQGTTTTASTSLSFTQYWYKADIATANTWVEGTASSNTFTTGTSSKTGIYVIDVDTSSMTATYKYLRMNCASAANATGTLLYIPYCPRFAADPASLVDASS